MKPLSNAFPVAVGSSGGSRRNSGSSKATATVSAPSVIAAWSASGEPCEWTMAAASRPWFTRYRVCGSVRPKPMYRLPL
jgi:hypothetical protein